MYNTKITFINAVVINCVYVFSFPFQESEYKTHKRKNRQTDVLLFSYVTLHTLLPPHEKSVLCHVQIT